MSVSSKICVNRAGIFHPYTPDWRALLAPTPAEYRMSEGRASCQDRYFSIANPIRVSGVNVEGSPFRFTNVSAGSASVV